MCGITGFIGKSKNPELTFDLINSLLVETEIRGEHATGFWAATQGKDSKILYHKEPIKSSQFVTKDVWKNLKDISPDILLGHCRFSSPGVGSEKTNKNNHPHVSKDKTTALIHNGRILEYSYLKNKYPVSTECDSEVLLRIFEHGLLFKGDNDFLHDELPKIKEKNAEILHEVYSLKKVFSLIHSGHMAVAIGQHVSDNEDVLWLFRNEERPLILIDLRDVLGQIFFCSTPFIFRFAYENSKIKDFVSKNQEVMEVPANYLYRIVNKDGNVEMKSFKLSRFKKYGAVSKEEPKATVKEGAKLVFPIITQLDDNDELKCEKKKSEPVSNEDLGDVSTEKHIPSNFEDDVIGCAIMHEKKKRPDLRSETLSIMDVRRKLPHCNSKEFGQTTPMPLDQSLTKLSNLQKRLQTMKENPRFSVDDDTVTRLEAVCDEISEVIYEIKTTLTNELKSQSIKPDQAIEVIESLESSLKDLQSTKYIIGR